jgi:hypothetical protein
MPGYSFVQTSNSSLAISGKYDTNGLIKSEFARLNYNFDRRYYLSGSIRQDANFQVFGPNKQKGVFPSVSAGWNINEERFFKPLTSIIDLLKLYGSYGTLGNSNIAPYSFNSSYSQFASSSGGATGAQNFAPGGPLLQRMVLLIQTYIGKQLKKRILALMVKPLMVGYILRQNGTIKIP